jgi:hypothetical protein
VPKDIHTQYSSVEERSIARKFVGCSVDSNSVTTRNLSAENITIQGQPLSQFITNNITTGGASSGTYIPIVSDLSPPGSLTASIDVQFFSWIKVGNTVDVSGIMTIPTESVTIPPPSPQTIPPSLFQFNLTLPPLLPADVTPAFGNGVFSDFSGSPPDYPGPQFRMANLYPVGTTQVRVYLQGNIPHDGGLTVHFRYQTSA